MIELQQEIIEGVMIGVREASANLFKVANSGEAGAQKRASLGIRNVRVTAELMLELVKREFEREDGS